MSLSLEGLRMDFVVAFTSCTVGVERGDAPPTRYADLTAGPQVGTITSMVFIVLTY